jgi:hypothetical protein
MSTARALLATGVALCAVACHVRPNPNEKTAPALTVTLADKLHNQGWPADQRVVQAGGSLVVDPHLDILITVAAKDPGGMKALDSNLVFYANACGGNGVFESPLDVSNQSATPHPPGSVADTLFYVHELTTHSLKAQPCDPLKTTSAGLGTVVLLSRATNQSNRATNFAFNIRTAGGRGP